MVRRMIWREKPKKFDSFFHFKCYKSDKEEWQKIAKFRFNISLADLMRAILHYAMANKGTLDIMLKGLRDRNDDLIDPRTRDEIQGDNE